MKKLTLSIGLLVGILSANAQDTLCTYFTGKDVYHFDYQQDTILSKDKQTTKFYQVNLREIKERKIDKIIKININFFTIINYL